MVQITLLHFLAINLLASLLIAKNSRLIREEPPQPYSCLVRVIVTEEPNSNRQINAITDIVRRHGFQDFVQIESKFCTQEIVRPDPNINIYGKPIPVAEKKTGNENEHKVVPSNFKQYRDCPLWEFVDQTGNELATLLGPHGRLIIEETLLRVVGDSRGSILKTKENGVSVQRLQNKQLAFAEHGFRKKIQQNEHNIRAAQGRIGSVESPKSKSDIRYQASAISEQAKGLFGEGQQVERGDEVDTLNMVRKEVEEQSSIWWHLWFLLSIVLVFMGTLYLIKKEGKIDAVTHRESTAIDMDH